MAHDNYHQFYTWNKGTLILDPGVFAWDEPHMRICKEPRPYANALDRIADTRKMSARCRLPDRLLSFKHSPAPASVLAKCDTIKPGRAYCCPPYAMPRNWRKDLLPMGSDNGTLREEADLFAEEARQIGAEVEAGIAPVADEVSADAQALIDEVEAGMGPVTVEARERIRRWPLVSVGFGLLAGAVIGKWMAGR